MFGHIATFCLHMTQPRSRSSGRNFYRNLSKNTLFEIVPKHFIRDFYFLTLWNANCYVSQTH
jgi:hypothetical protein